MDKQQVAVAIMTQAIALESEWADLNTKYKTLVNMIREAGCTRKDVLPFMKKQAKRAGHFATEEDYDRDCRLGKGYTKAIRGVVAHVKRHYHATKWEFKQTDEEIFQESNEQLKAKAAYDALSEDEKKEAKEKEKANHDLLAERKCAEFFKNNQAHLKRLAEKEGVVTPMETLIETMVKALEANRVGI